MLLRFSFENFRSFKNKTTLKMLATTQRTLNDVLIRKGKHRILPSAVLYGANASGKSNVILAMMTFRAIVKNGSISKSAKPIMSSLELFPFLNNEDISRPITFEIEFIDGEDRFVYGFSFSVESLERNGKRFILEEYLDLVLSKMTVRLFHRTRDNIIVGKDKHSLKLLVHKKADHIQMLVDTMIQNMDEEVLFLTGGFKSTISKAIADKITDYISNKINPKMNPLTALNNTAFIFQDEQVPAGDAIFGVKYFDSIMRIADFGPQKIRWRMVEKEENKQSVRRIQMLSEYGKSIIPSELMESTGTIKLLLFSILLKHCFAEGRLLMIDELDNAIHPEIMKGIIALFGNPEINKKGAQLVFTSHNLIYMDHDLLRRDQIFFTEKDLDTYISTMHSLSDFGSVSVRNDQSFMRNYFKGRYGRLPYIDFETVLALDLED